MIIDDLYAECVSLGLTRSKRHFSRQFLGKREQYLSTMRGDASPDALVHLHAKLVEIGHTDLAAKVVQRTFGVSSELV